MMDRYAEVFGYLNSMWRRRWYALAIAVLTCIVGWTAVALIPNTYTSTGKIYIDSETVLSPLLKGLAVERDFDAEVKIMQQTLLTRPNLAKVARATDLDLTVTGPEQMESLLTGIANRTTVASPGTNLFSISFHDARPSRAKDAVQSYLNIVMEGRLGESRTDMDSARRFIDEQIEHYQRELDMAERRLAEFKQRNLTLLSGPRGYQARLEEARASMAAARAALQDAETEREVLVQQLSSIPDVIEAVTQGVSGPPSDYAIRIVQLQATLDDLLSKYTERHPDVLSVRQRIRQLEAEQEREMRAMTEVTDSTASPGRTGPRYGVPNPAHSQLQLILAEKEATIARLKEQVVRSEDNSAQVESLALEVPIVEAELTRLTRDYDVLKQQYETFLQRRESAKISREREARGEKVQFRIVEPPEVPIVPSGPNRALLLTAVLPLGLGAGAAFAFVLAFFSDTFADPRRLGADLRLPVLGAVSIVGRPGDARRRLFDMSAFGLVAAGLILVFAFLMTVENAVGWGGVANVAANATSPGQVISAVSDTVSLAFSARAQ